MSDAYDARAHGHVLVYTLGDVMARFRRRNGWTVCR
jgi:leucyl-tRNA synthetase